MVAGAAIPYGYTALVWSSGGYGSPSPAEALLFRAGAVAGFVAVALAGYTGDSDGQHSDVDARWVSVSSGIAATVSLAAAVGAAAAFRGPLGFGVATLLATILYLLVTAAGVILAPHRRR